jgi:hypothetical protein
MATFKELAASDVKTSPSVMNQLVDIVQEDVSGSATRKKYAVFITGSTSTPGVTSSLFQTIYDQDHTLQTANPIFDMTVGLYPSGSTVTGSAQYGGVDTNGKLIFDNPTVMMREKVDLYKQFAQVLLGDANGSFFSPFGDTNSGNRIEEALFISFKRLFSRDKLKRETFAMRWYQTASKAPGVNEAAGGTSRGPNLFETSDSGSVIFTDVGASTNKRRTFGGDVGDIVDSSDTSRKVGNIFYDAGVAVLDVAKIISGTQHASGTVPALFSAGTAVLGSADATFTDVNATFIPDMFTHCSIDTIVEHLASARMQSGSLTAITFQNNTNINSTLLYCRASADEFNYSSNPTYVDNENRIVVIDDGQEDVQRSFTFITTVGLYDANDNLLAVAKLSRPIEKNDEKDLTLTVRLDY